MTLPDDMQALVLLQAGYASALAGVAPPALTGLVALQRVPVPRPGPGQVLVKVALSPINPSDLLYIAGTYGQPRARGTPAGFEGTGVVVAAGDPRAAALNARRVSFLASASGAWADYALADAASCVAVDDELRDEDAAALLVNPLTAITMIDIAARLGVNAVVLTAAGSQLGRMMIPLARERDIVPIAIVRKPDAIGSLQELGAAEVLASSAPGFAGQLASVLRARKPRVLFDAVGDQLAADIFLAMPSHSRWISYGILSARGPCLPDMRSFVFQGKGIEGFWLSRWFGAADPVTRARATQEAQRRFLDGTWRTQIAARVPLGDTPRGLPPVLDLPGKVLLAP